MQTQGIQWFPGHMTKTRRQISENLSSVDAVLELLDARVPFSSKNPEIYRLCSQKPILTVMNKGGLADKAMSKRWVESYTAAGLSCVAIDTISGEGFHTLVPAIRKLLELKLRSYSERGMSGRKIKLMVLGVPNVGKSTLINKLAGERKAKAEDRPGVTRAKQWVTCDHGIDLLDMPGVLWPKFDNRLVGDHLAITGAISDQVFDIIEIAAVLCERLTAMYPALLCERYKLDSSILQLNSHDLLEAIGRKRGFLLRGGVVDLERTAVILVDEFRGGKIGRISIETPEML